MSLVEDERDLISNASNASLLYSFSVCLSRCLLSTGTGQFQHIGVHYVIPSKSPRPGIKGLIRGGGGRHCGISPAVTSQTFTK